ITLAAPFTLTDLDNGAAVDGGATPVVTKANGNYYVQVQSSETDSENGYHQVEIDSTGAITTTALSGNADLTTAEMAALDSEVVTTVPNGKQVDVDFTDLDLENEVPGGNATLIKNNEDGTYYV